MPNRLSAPKKSFFQLRDELSFRNIRANLWPAVLVFPLSIIVSNIRYYDHTIALFGFAQESQDFILLGLGWLILSLVPKHLVVPLLRLSVIISVFILIFLNFMPWGLWRQTLYMVCKVFNGFSVACAFYLFCFLLNNIERLLGMAFIQFYYGFYYTTWAVAPIIHTESYVWISIIVSVIFLVVVFLCRTSQQEIKSDSDGKGSEVLLILVLFIVHYIIMNMIHYIEWSESGISIFAFGLGSFVSISLVIIIQLLKSRSALYGWILFLVLSILGLGTLLLNSHITFIFGSFSYGLGDSLGFIIIYYICAGAIKRSQSLRVFKLFCLVCFVEYSIISSFLSFYFSYFETQNNYLAFGVVLLLVTLCFLFMPYIQKKLFEADWTDGLFLKDMEEYLEPLAETEKITVKNHLNLTLREEEIFTLLLKGKAPKEIGFILKISYDTVLFHQKKLYRKLGVQSIAELFSLYMSKN